MISVPLENCDAPSRVHLFPTLSFDTVPSLGAKIAVRVSLPSARFNPASELFTLETRKH